MHVEEVPADEAAVVKVVAAGVVVGELVAADVPAELWPVLLVAVVDAADVAAVVVPASLTLLTVVPASVALHAYCV